MHYLWTLPVPNLLTTYVIQPRLSQGVPGPEDVLRLASQLGIDQVELDLEDFRIPTNASSEFLMNRAMGDWAEERVARLVEEAGLFPTGYGDVNTMDAGDEGFEEMFTANRANLLKYGKKPDLLVFTRQDAERLGIPPELRGLDEAEQDRLVSKALAGLEVRSSKFQAKIYHSVRQEQLRAGEVVPKRFQSFTPKVEDLPLIIKWVEMYKVKHLYVQVFFDEIHAISFAEILRALFVRSHTHLRGRAANAIVDGFPVSLLREVKLTAPKRSNFKKTHFIPVPLGTLCAEIRDFANDGPKFELKTRATRLGRLDAYVKPVGGSFSLVGAGFLRLLSAQ